MMPCQNFLCEALCFLFSQISFVGGGGGVHHGMTFNFGSSKVCSPVIFETSFSYDKDVSIAVTDIYMHFYIIVFFPFIAILQLMNFTAS